MTCRQPHAVLWTSEPLSIGKHEWRIVVAHFPHLEAAERATGEHDSAGRASFYEWRRLSCRGSPRDWRDECEWPTYDSDRSDCGTPRTLRKLWEREATTVRSILCPHCTAQTGTAPPQLSLFGSSPDRGRTMIYEVRDEPDDPPIICGTKNGAIRRGRRRAERIGQPA